MEEIDDGSAEHDLAGSTRKTIRTGRSTDPARERGLAKSVPPNAAVTAPKRGGKPRFVSVRAIGRG
jgi:hypothetical protein